MEKHGLIWLWMGDENQLDDSKIPNFSCLGDTARYTTVGGTIHMEANYELITDNPWT